MNDCDLKFIDLFSGCGGLSLGLLNAGWNGVFAIEKNNDAFNTFKSNLIDNKSSKNPNNNFFRWPDWLATKAWDISSFLETYSFKLPDSLLGIDLLVGGPPCQGFSSAGKRNGNDPRNQLFKEYIRMVTLLNPKIILFENVKGMGVPFIMPRSKKLKSKSFALSLREKLENIPDQPYFIEQEVIQSENFGVPQFRPRLFTIGFSKKYFQTPPNFFESLMEMRRDFLKSKGLSNEPITVSQAISDIARCMDTTACTDIDSPPGFKEIDYKPGINNLSPFQKLMRKGVNKDYKPNSLRLVNHRKKTIDRFESIQNNCRKGVSLSDQERLNLKAQGVLLSKKRAIVALSGSQPSHTITTIPDDLLHYEQPRVHTVREYARFQSFPDWFEFKGRYTTGGAVRKDECPRYTQVGNAVPPLLAEAFGELLKGILTDRK